MTFRIWWVRWLPLVLCTVLGAQAVAAPKRILVLPLDGNADGATRQRLNATVQKLAKGGSSGATVTVGDATYDETAAAVGCDPAAPKCAVSVRTTLGVDELVFGTVTTDPSGQTTIVIRTSSVTDNPPHETTLAIAANQPPEEAERQLAPLFGVTPSTAAPGATPPPPSQPQPAQPASEHDTTRRNIGIACAVGGGALLVAGLAAWSSESGKQDEIDAAPTKTVADLQHLQDLEDRAQKFAIAGDLLVLGGLALGGYGGWLIYKDHKERTTVVVTPVATPVGPAVTIGGVW